MGTVFNADIIIRNGNNENFDPSKLRQGEPAVSIDTKQFFVGLGSGQVMELATKESVANVNNSFSNAVKGKASGRFLNIDDVSPITHELKIKVKSETDTDLTGMTVRRYGKNQLDFTSIKEDISRNKVALLDNGFRISGNYYAGVWSVPVLPNTDYNLSYITNHIKGDIKKVVIFGSDKLTTANTLKGFTNGVGGTFNTEEHNTILIAFYVNSSSSTTDISDDTIEFTDIQLELGTETTEYEPYVPAIEASVSEDGTVKGITSIYPTTVIVGDTADVTFKCEYNRDLNKVIDNLTQAILSLGGNV